MPNWTISSDKPQSVAILLFPGFSNHCLANAVEPLRAANLLSRKTLYEVVHFSADGSCESSGGARVERSFEIGETPDLDLLLVVAGGNTEVV